MLVPFWHYLDSAFNSFSWRFVLKIRFSELYRQRYLFDIGLIVIIGCLVGYIVVARQSSTNFIGDTAWILNRGHVYFHGSADSFWVYTLTYPLLVGAVDLLVHNLALAAILVSTLSICVILIGTYLLARMFFARNAAWLSVLLLIGNTGFVTIANTLQNHILFMAVVLWIVLLSIYVARNPTNLGAILLGVLLGIALYTRLEGACYSIILLPVMWAIRRKTGNWRKALRLGAISGIIFLFALVFFYVNYVKDVDPNPATNDTIGNVRILTTVPVRWDIMSRRLTDTFTGTIGQWPLWAWWLVLGWLIWQGRRSWVPSVICLAVIVFNFLYILALVFWPDPHYLSHYLPFFALLFGAALVYFARQKILRPFVTLAVVAASIPGFLLVLNYPSPFAYQGSAAQQMGMAVDQWVSDQHLQNTPIYTLCNGILPFSQSNIQYVQIFSNNLNLNTPDIIVQRVKANNGLFMTCSEPTYWLNWKQFLYTTDPGNLQERLRQVGQVNDYTLFEASNGQ